MGFPAKLTEEEQILVNKYEAIKRKKKSGGTKKTQVTSLAAESAKPVSVVNIGKETSRNDNRIKESAMKPKDAKEIAKQRLAAGQLKINKDTESRSYKRARPSTGERKPRAQSLTEAAFTSSNQQQTKKIEHIRKDSYSNFVPGTEKSEEGGDRDEKFQQRRSFEGRQQRNLYISGYGLTRNIIDTAFVDFGPIKNTYFDQDKGCGYVTFHRADSAKKAIEDLHGSQVQGVNLKVAYAWNKRRDDNRFTTRPSRIRPDDSSRGERLFTDNTVHHSDQARQSSDDSPTKKPDVKKRKLVKYDDTESSEFNF